MEPISEKTLNDLLQSIQPWFDQEQAFIFDLAKTDWAARLAVAAALLQSGKENEASVLLQSIAESNPSQDPEQEGARIRASLELATLLMDELKYDDAEHLLWQARDSYNNVPDLDFIREEISIMIAQCRFGQGFVQEAIDRVEEILQKLKHTEADKSQLLKVYQQLGWFYIHKSDVPTAMEYIRKAMELAPNLDQELVGLGLEAEKNNDYEKAVEYYYDAIGFEN